MAHSMISESVDCRGPKTILWYSFLEELGSFAPAEARGRQNASGLLKSGGLGGALVTVLQIAYR